MQRSRSPTRRVRGHGDDGHARVAAAFQFPDAARRLEAIEDGHLHVHQHQIELAVAEEVDRLLPILGDNHLMAVPAEHAHGEPLIDMVVLGQEDSQRLSVGLRRRLLPPAVRRH